MSYEIEKIMDTPEGQKDYEQRSRTVEAHNGTFKRIYKFNELQITGLDNMRGYLFKTAASYNTIRLFNIVVGKGWDIFEVILSIRVIALNKAY